jgi:5-methylcytosine-specific restriction enzyme subunit McrC
MLDVDLREYATSDPLALSVDERDGLLDRKDLGLTIAPVTGSADKYTLTPGSVVGAVEIGGLSLRIAPKIGIGPLLSLACYAIAKVEFQAREFDFPEHSALPDALALAFGSAARRAFSRGLLHGYRTEEDALPAVRGRIRFDDQIRRRFGIPLPVELRWDEFTDDILLNRLVKAAAQRLGRLRLRSREARSAVSWVAESLRNVSLVAFPPGAVPEVRFDRLNEHYRDVVELSRLILRHTSIETKRGNVRATGFLVDMNVVFQEFVTRALRQALGLSERTFRSDNRLPKIWLEHAGRVRLKPDLTWWDGHECTFVGDAKYKKVEDDRVPNADLYQLLAYATALNLPGGLLVYAKGEDAEVVHCVRNAGKRLEVAALDLSGSIDDMHVRIGELASRVRELRRRVRRGKRSDRVPAVGPSI